MSQPGLSYCSRDRAAVLYFTTPPCRFFPSHHRYLVSDSCRGLHYHGASFRLPHCLRLDIWTCENNRRRATQDSFLPRNSWCFLHFRILVQHLRTLVHISLSTLELVLLSAQYLLRKLAFLIPMELSELLEKRRIPKALEKWARNSSQPYVLTQEEFYSDMRRTLQSPTQYSDQTMRKEGVSKAEYLRQEGRSPATKPVARDTCFEARIRKVLNEPGSTQEKEYWLVIYIYHSMLDRGEAEGSAVMQYLRGVFHLKDVQLHSLHRDDFNKWEGKGYGFDT